MTTTSKMDKNSNKFQKHIIVVLGCHRSGTSAITRGLKVLGAELGKNLLSALPNNKAGFWEDIDILQLNENLLQKIDVAWHENKIIEKSVLVGKQFDAEKKGSNRIASKQIAGY